MRVSEGGRETPWCDSLSQRHACMYVYCDINLRQQLLCRAQQTTADSVPRDPTGSNYAKGDVGICMRTAFLDRRFDDSTLRPLTHHDLVAVRTNLQLDGRCRHDFFPPDSSATVTQPLPSSPHKKRPIGAKPLHLCLNLRANNRL